MNPRGTQVPGTPQQQILPAPPLSGRSAPCPLTMNAPGRVPVTPPAIAGPAVAGQLPVGDNESDDFMDTGERDKPLGVHPGHPGDGNHS
eukprot:3799803-Amphidinium_carterae.3